MVGVFKTNDVSFQQKVHVQNLAGTMKRRLEGIFKKKKTQTKVG